MEKQHLADKIEHAIQMLYSLRQQNEYFSISNTDGEHLVAVAEILFCKTTKVNPENGKKGFQFHLNDGRIIPAENTSLDHYEKLLTPFLFVKINPYCLINLLHTRLIKKEEGKIIVKVKGEGLEYAADKEFLIFKKYRERVLAQYEALFLPS